MKKTRNIIIIITTIIAICFSLTSLPVQADNEPANATETQTAGDNAASSGPTVSFEGRQEDGGDENGCKTFLGLIPWDCNIKITDENSLKTSIWNIAANIATDITIIAAYLVLGYIIYGGYLYIFSAGESGKVASARKTLTNAFIGLAIVLLANVILSSIRYALLEDAQLNCNPLQQNCVEPTTLVETAFQWIAGVSGTVAIIFVVYGAVALITSGQDPGRVQKAKQIILYALIGLAVVALSQVIAAFVTTTIKNSKESGFIIRQIINQK